MEVELEPVDLGPRSETNCSLAYAGPELHPVSRRLHLWDEAELDVVDAVAWYEEQRDGLGAAFLMELDVVMSRVSQTPLQFPEIKDGVRRALLHRFPYSLYFKDGDEIVEVVAILHNHRHARGWRQRLK